MMVQLHQVRSFLKRKTQRFPFLNSWPCLHGHEFKKERKQAQLADDTLFFEITNRLGKRQAERRRLEEIQKKKEAEDKRRIMILMTILTMIMTLIMVMSLFE